MLRKASALKLLAASLILWLLINLVLFALGKISTLMFWIVLAVFALIAWKGIPLLKRKV